VEEIPESELIEFGTEIKRKNNTYSIEIPREKTAEITGKLLEKYTIDDIVIHERDIEEIIEEIFISKKMRN